MKDVDVNHTEIPMCVCQQVEQYLLGRSIKIKGNLNCHSNPPESPEKTFYCPVKQNETQESPVYHTCLELVKTKQLKEETQMTWLTIILGLFAFFVIFMLTLYLLHLRSVRQSKKAKMAIIAAKKKSNPNENPLIREERV